MENYLSNTINQLIFFYSLPLLPFLVSCLSNSNTEVQEITCTLQYGTWTEQNNDFCLSTRPTDYIFFNFAVFLR